ncbi:MAG: HEPN domain-containing protein [Anaerolineales bacterium]
MLPHLEEARRSLRLAKRDIHAFDVLRASSEIHLSVICFHAQQAIEKLLKAILFLHQIEFRRTHNLNDLSALLIQNGIQVPVFDTDLLMLTPFAVTFRYDEMEVDWIDLAQVVNLVQIISTWADEQLRNAE